MVSDARNLVSPSSPATTQCISPGRLWAWRSYAKPTNENENLRRFEGAATGGQLTHPPPGEPGLPGEPQGSNPDEQPHGRPSNGSVCPRQRCHVELPEEKPN